MDSLFEYFDYQQWLRDYYEYRKQRHSYFSYRYMSAKTGIDPAFLVKVLQGKVHITLKSVPRIAALCGFDTRETRYFEYLVRYGRAKKNDEIKKCFEKLLSMREQCGISVEESQYEFYQKWYHSAIRSLIGAGFFNSDYAHLARQLSPAVTPEQACSSVELLGRLGMIQKEKDGRYALAKPLITTGRKWQSSAIHQFQKECIKLAGESLDRHPKERRDISTVTIAVSHKDMDAIRELTQQYRHALLNLKTENETVDCVYQVNVQIFPLSEVQNIQ